MCRCAGIAIGFRRPDELNNDRDGTFALSLQTTFLTQSV